MYIVDLHNLTCLNRSDPKRLEQRSKASGSSGWTPMEGELTHDRESMANLWSRRCFAREEHETCFHSSGCVVDGF